jgi:hypothetical protein
VLTQFRCRTGKKSYRGPGRRQNIKVIIYLYLSADVSRTPWQGSIDNFLTPKFPEKASCQRNLNNAFLWSKTELEPWAGGPSPAPEQRRQYLAGPDDLRPRWPFATGVVETFSSPSGCTRWTSSLAGALGKDRLRLRCRERVCKAAGPVDRYRRRVPSAAARRNKRLRRRSGVAASAANLQQNLAVRLKCRPTRWDCSTKSLFERRPPWSAPAVLLKAIAHLHPFVQPRSVPGAAIGQKYAI